MARQTHPDPGIQQLEEAWQRAEAQDAFWREHHEEIRAEYPEQFVAVSAAGLVAASPDLSELTNILETKGVRPTDYSVHFAHVEPPHDIL